MRAPVRRLLKREVEWLGTNFCKHSHTYLEHYNCFVTTYPEGIEGIISLPEKIGISRKTFEKVWRDLKDRNLLEGYSYKIWTSKKDNIEYIA